MTGTLSISKFFTKLKDKQILQNVFFQALYLINTLKETREQVLTAMVVQWWLTWKMKTTFHSKQQQERNSLLQRSSQKFRTPPAESPRQWAPAKLSWLGEDPPALFGCTADTVVSSTAREKCCSCDHTASTWRWFQTANVILTQIKVWYGRPRTLLCNLWDCTFWFHQNTQRWKRQKELSSILRHSCWSNE